jgi:hypothetical protein
MQRLKRLLKDRKGSMVAYVVIGTVVSIIVVIIGLMVAMLVTGQLSVMSTSVLGNNSTYGSNATSLAINSTASSLFSSAFSALSLANILPFILVAALIIASITVIFGVTAYRRR